tara:strand:- start:10621 stop:11178 length:558 start_codon:yes stop_codon:yes gene_type:complete
MTPYEQFRERLRSIYGDEPWIAACGPVFDSVRTSESVAIAGSIGVSVCFGKCKKQPGDIDLVARDVQSARGLLAKLEDFLLADKAERWWSVKYNSSAKFVPSQAQLHIRIENGMWLPICIFVLKPGGFKSWFTKEAYPVQFLAGMKAAADELDTKSIKKIRAVGEVLDDSGRAEFWDEDSEPFDY